MSKKTRENSSKLGSGKNSRATSDGDVAPSRSPPAQEAPDLAVGDKLPDFRLPAHDGTVVSAADFAGQHLVIFFYPRADTPGCTTEAIDFSRLAPAFADAGAALLGISADPLKAQVAFRTKHKLTVTLASDETHATLQEFGVWGEKSMYGKVFQGIVRTTVVVGKDGRIAKIWPRVKVAGHADEVLQYIRDL